MELGYGEGVWESGGPEAPPSVLVRGKFGHRRREKLCDDRGRDWGRWP